MKITDDEFKLLLYFARKGAIATFWEGGDPTEILPIIARIKELEKQLEGGESLGKEKTQKEKKDS